jgi:DNA-binding NtrC family response regulator
MKTLAARDSEHVLIVDDDRGIRDLLGRFLTKHGHRGTACG